MFEFDDIESPVRDKIAELEAAWHGFLSDLTRRAVELGHLRTGLDIERFVSELGGIYRAHHVSQRFRRSPESDRRAATAFQALVERSQPPARTRTTRNKGTSNQVASRLSLIRKPWL
jgi:hypothetical protein